MDEFKQFRELFGTKIGQVIQKPRRLFFVVKEEHLLEIVKYLFDGIGCRLSTATAQETYHGLEILYHFSLDKAGIYFCPRIVISDKQNPKVLSITALVPGAVWIEREMFDLWGIEFVGHPRMEQLLTLNSPENPNQPLRFGRQA